MRIRRMLVLGLLTLTASGCGGSHRDPSPVEVEQGVLTDLGEMVRSYQSLKKKPPRESRRPGDRPRPRG